MTVRCELRVEKISLTACISRVERGCDLLSDALDNLEHCVFLSCYAK